jgi:hypothetical protein
MARCILLALSLALAFPAWGQAPKARAKKKPAPSENVAAPKDCPAKFEEFLERFESDFTFQTSVVRYPLPMAFIDDGV